MEQKKKKWNDKPETISVRSGNLLIMIAMAFDFLGSNTEIAFFPALLSSCILLLSLYSSELHHNHYLFFDNFLLGGGEMFFKLSEVWLDILNQIPNDRRLNNNQKEERERRGIKDTLLPRVSLGVKRRRSQKRDFIGTLGLTTGLLGPAFPLPGGPGNPFPFIPSNKSLTL